MAHTVKLSRKLSDMELKDVKVQYSEQWGSYYVYGPSGGFTKVYDRKYHESCLAMHQVALTLIPKGK